ncbi:MAG: hypothetical protein HC841_08745 [Verrucomicrobiae bacterium]|nr:hypothetical protein [Verrucomicrobiae bacterium]
MINLAALRRELFASAIGPSCIVTFKPGAPAHDASLAYVTPKPTGTSEDALRITVDLHDVHFLRHDQAAVDDLVWSVLMWGGMRDLQLVRRIMRQPSLDSLRNAELCATREGFIRGKGNPTLAPEIVGRRYLLEKDFPGHIFEPLEAESLTLNQDPKVHRRDKDRLKAFDPPQVIFKQAWKAGKNRFEAVIVIPDNNGNGALCSDSYVSIRDLTESRDLSGGVWLILNSNFAPYWFTLTCGQFAGFIPKATETELRQLPALRFPNNELPAIAKAGYPAIDETVFELLGLNEAEQNLVEDIHQVVLPDAQRQGGDPPGYKGVSPRQLEAYADTFRKVLEATFGESQPIAITLFESSQGPRFLCNLWSIQWGANCQPGASVVNPSKHLIC